MLTLQKMLRVFVDRHQKVLVFSYSTQVLDLVQSFVLGSGWRHLRLDGSTASASRLSLCDEFNDSTKGIQIFLASSKAGGLGLNLKAASKGKEKEFE